MVTDGSGAVIARHDFLPFGDEIPANSMGRSSADLWALADNISQKFTGQERDETGLDYFDARFFSSAVGRFISPDPMSIGADLYNPQTWNGYAYVTNSPLSDVDPDGTQTASSGSTGESGGSAGGATNGLWGPTLGFTFDNSLGIAGNFGHFDGSDQPGGVQYTPSGLAVLQNDAPWFHPGGAESVARLSWVQSMGSPEARSPKTCPGSACWAPSRLGRQPSRATRQPTQQLSSDRCLLAGVKRK